MHRCGDSISERITSVMKPVAQALNIPQSENKMFMSYLLLTVNTLQEKLVQRQATAVVCGSLITAFIDSSFAAVYDDRGYCSLYTAPKVQNNLDRQSAHHWYRHPLHPEPAHIVNFCSCSISWRTMTTITMTSLVTGEMTSTSHTVLTYRWTGWDWSAGWLWSRLCANFATTNMCW